MPTGGRRDGHGEVRANSPGPLVFPARGCRNGVSLGEVGEGKGFEVYRMRSYRTQLHGGSERNNGSIFLSVLSAVAESQHDFLPFGEKISPAPSDNTHQFTGHERDRETGSDYMLARYHESDQARFLAPDPLQSSARPSSAQSWNRYSYVGNNPMNREDPTGLDVPPENRSI